VTNPNETARFQNRPNSDDLPEIWKILRCPKRGTPQLAIVGADVLGCYVHYWSGRTRPCNKVSCDICERGQQPRWRGYLPVLTPSPSTPKILEVTPSIIGDIDRWLNQEGTLRGSVIQLNRKGNVQNGELSVKIGKPAGFDVNLPDPPDVYGILCRIWRITHDPRPSEAATDNAAALYRSRSGRVASADNGHSRAT